MGSRGGSMQELYRQLGLRAGRGVGKDPGGKEADQSKVKSKAKRPGTGQKTKVQK